MPFSWRVPEDQIDVHMIAIAANVTPGYDDDLFGGIYLGGDDFSWDDDGAAARKLEGENDFRINELCEYGIKGAKMVLNKRKWFCLLFFPQRSSRCVIIILKAGKSREVTESTVAVVCQPQ